MKRLPTKNKGRPLLLGQILDTAIQDYIKALHTVGGVVNTSIVMDTAKGIVASCDQGVFLTDIQAEVEMNDIPNEIIFNSDQTALYFVPSGQWTMHHAKYRSPNYLICMVNLHAKN